MTSYYEVLFETLTELGATSAIEVARYSKHTVQVKVTSIVAAINLTIEGSMDGTNWFVCPINSTEVPDVTYFLNGITIGDNGTYEFHTNLKMRYLRVNWEGPTGKDEDVPDLFIRYFGGNE